MIEDDTPSFLEWLKLFHPEEYIERVAKSRALFVDKPQQGDVPEDHFGKDPKEEWK